MNTFSRAAGRGRQPRPANERIPLTPFSRRPARLAAALLAVVALAGFAAESSEAPPGNETPKTLDAVNVYGERYQPMPLDVPGGIKWFFGLKLGLPPTGIQMLGTYVVTATRTPQPPERVAATTQIFDAEALRTAPVAAIDNVLRTAPSFSLFRRSDSLTANPTAQGVSLRGLGPSGASRSLVLLDGVPLNDPFGGWVAWTKVPAEAIRRVEVVPGGGASAWGNAALGGVVQLFTARPRTHMVMIDQPPAPTRWATRGTAGVSVTVGDFGLRRATAALTRPVGSGIVQLLAEDFSIDGFTLVAPERRGPIDVAAWSRHRAVTVRWQQLIGQKVELTATARGYEEFRGNGTPYQKNGSREKFASVQLLGQPTDTFAWNAVAYAQDQSFASTFSAVNATRSAETPASDQFAVPATALGAAFTGAWKLASGGRTSGGVDARAVHGETRENYSFAAGDFTRQRVAGGSQSVAGLFALHEQPLTPALRLTVGGRVDFWSDANGHRRETERATGGRLRDDRYAGRDGVEFSPSAGVVWTPNRVWRIRGNAQEAFRRPTLNELYRPFRQGANVTEANATLRTERVTSTELGAEWTLYRNWTVFVGSSKSPKTTTRKVLTVGATAFWNELRDAVGNVTLARGPGTFPLFGTLPAGGIGRQRLNLDRTRVRGLELTANWDVTASVAVKASYLYNDATVRATSVAPGLVGKRLAEVPRHNASVGSSFTLPGKFVLTPRLRWISRQFDDDENTLRLGEVVIVDVGLTRPLTKNLELFLNVENAGNARIETARSADGVVNVGTPRLAFGGLRGSW